MKKLINVVVIDDNTAVTSSIKKYFLDNANINIVGIFPNGKEGLAYLLNNVKDYDIIILDVLLPNIDGIRILEQLKAEGIEKKEIVLSSYKDDYTIQRVKKLGANFYMLKPFSMESLERRIMDLSSDDELLLDNYKESIEYEVSSLLHDLGIPSHLRGYQYIRDGIILLYSNEFNNTLVTKDIYPEIANKYETTSSRVERAIRHAIEISWIRGDIHKMENLFGNSIDFERSKPTNFEFLSTIADRIRLTKNLLVG